jgi:hypothetical protein
MFSWIIVNVSAVADKRRSVSPSKKTGKKNLPLVGYMLDDSIQGSSNGRIEDSDSPEIGSNPMP